MGISLGGETGAERKYERSDACFLHNVGRNILYLYQNKAFSENREIGT